MVPARVWVLGQQPARVSVLVPGPVPLGAQVLGLRQALVRELAWVPGLEQVLVLEPVQVLAQARAGAR